MAPLARRGAFGEKPSPGGHVATGRDRWMLVSEDEGGEIDVGAGRCHVMEAVEMVRTRANADTEEWDIVQRASDEWLAAHSQDAKPKVRRSCSLLGRGFIRSCGRWTAPHRPLLIRRLAPYSPGTALHPCSARFYLIIHLIHLIHLIPLRAHRSPRRRPSGDQEAQGRQAREAREGRQGRQGGRRRQRLCEGEWRRQRLQGRAGRRGQGRGRQGARHLQGRAEAAQEAQGG